ncbi:hypothetical protein [Streptomyces sp. NPDC088258]|uniref:hypothetical protein n=1 Tax=Streptomyces sp. NPDC088258 TaxID=3365849 RepID=UPI003823B195
MTHPESREWTGLTALVRALFAAESGTEEMTVPLGLGQRLFDVMVFGSGPVGEAVVRDLDETQQPYGCGPVIVDPARPDLLFGLVPPGTSRHWSHRLGHCLGSGTFTLPPLGRLAPPGAYWHRPWRSTHLLGPGMLHTALDRHRPALPPLGVLPQLVLPASCPRIPTYLDEEQPPCDCQPSLTSGDPAFRMRVPCRSSPLGAARRPLRRA